MTGRMDPGFALFNYHVNDAAEKAKELFIRTFGEEKWQAEIQPFVDTGVMAILNEPVTFYTGFYVAAVTLIVNGDVDVNNGRNKYEPPF